MWSLFGLNLLDIKRLTLEELAIMHARCEAVSKEADRG